MSVDIIVNCCIDDCEMVRLNPTSKIWYDMNEQTNSVKSFYKEYQISHGYCPKHLKEFYKENGLEYKGD